MGQSSGNDNNANQKYPTLDASIKNTYLASGSGSARGNIYDSYIRAIRWASNRILTSPDGGVVAYVSNGGYIDSNAADGLRKTLVDEFHDIYVYNLRGNQRTAGEQSRKEGGKIFDSGSRNTVAVLILVKRPGSTPGASLHYKDIGDYLDRADKLAILDAESVETIDWECIKPNADGDWINHRNVTFDSFAPVGDKKYDGGMFAVYSAGVKTNRDAWVYNSSRERLRANVEATSVFYNSEVERYVRFGSVGDPADFVNADSTKISWSTGLRARLSKHLAIDTAEGTYMRSTYRPFMKQHLYFSSSLNEARSLLPSLVPAVDGENYGFYLNGVHAFADFAVFAMDTLPSLDVFGKGGHFFPRYTYATPSAGDDLFSAAGAPSSPERVDNITDATMMDYRAAYGASVSKDDIFFYVYGLLHSPEYRTEFAADLKKLLPRIPKVPGAEKFIAFSQAGRKLSALHIGYEQQKPYPLTEVETAVVPVGDDYARYAVKKMKYGGKAGAWDKSRIVYNGQLTLEGIPESAQRYMLGARSAIDWIVERYQVKTDKPSGIVNDPNDWSREQGEPRYIIDLIGKIVTVSLETSRIVDSLPGLELEA